VWVCSSSDQCCGLDRPEGPGCCPPGMKCANQNTGLCEPI
jgi:hypothetical protein